MWSNKCDFRCGQLGKDWAFGVANITALLYEFAIQGTNIVNNKNNYCDMIHFSIIIDGITMIIMKTFHIVILFIILWKKCFYTLFIDFYSTFYFWGQP